MNQKQSTREAKLLLVKPFNVANALVKVPGIE
jgi:hypothetical protein